MSKAEIEYIVPELARILGDTERVINAMGTFEQHQPFPFDYEYDIHALETINNDVSIRLVRTTREPRTDVELRQYETVMQHNVNTYFSEADRIRCAGYFVKTIVHDPAGAELS